MSQSIISFVAGKFYSHNYIGDSDLLVKYKVVRRTAKSIWISKVNFDGSVSEVVQRKRIYIFRGEENVSLGSYSMAPTLSAKDVVLPPQIVVNMSAKSVTIPGEGEFTLAALGFVKIGQPFDMDEIKDRFHSFMKNICPDLSLAFV